MLPLYVVGTTLDCDRERLESVFHSQARVFTERAEGDLLVRSIEVPSSIGGYPVENALLRRFNGDDYTLVVNIKMREFKGMKIASVLLPKAESEEFDVLVVYGHAESDLERPCSYAYELTLGT